MNSTRLAYAWTIGILTNCTPLLLINKAYTYLKYLLAIWNTITRPTPTKVAHNQPRCDTKYTHTPTPQLAYTTYITLALFIHHSNTPQYALLSKYTTNYQLYAIIITYNPNPSIYNQQMNDNLDPRCHTTLPRLYNQPPHTHSKTQHIIPTHNTQNHHHTTCIHIHQRQHSQSSTHNHAKFKKRIPSHLPKNPRRINQMYINVHPNYHNYTTNHNIIYSNPNHTQHHTI